MRLFCCGDKERILRRGFARIEREMDLIGFFKDLRETKSITKLRADKFDRIFSKHQARFVIDMNAESTGSEPDCSGADEDIT